MIKQREGWVFIRVMRIQRSFEGYNLREIIIFSFVRQTRSAEISRHGKIQKVLVETDRYGAAMRYKHMRTYTSRFKQMRADIPKRQIDSYQTSTPTAPTKL